MLVDRLWPRGISKEQLQLDEWLREIAPSDELRKWYHHEPEKFESFEERYIRELEHHGELVERLIEKGRNGTVTLVYSAKDRENNNAVVLKNYLEVQMTDREKE